MEKNIVFAILIISLVLVGTLSFVIGEKYFLGENFQYSYTKAICNENNYCEDYEVVCGKNKMLGLNPTSFAVQFSSDWKDPRNKEDVKIKC